MAGPPGSCPGRPGRRPGRSRWSEPERGEDLEPLKDELAPQLGREDVAILPILVVLVLHANADVASEVVVGRQAPVGDRGLAALGSDLDVEEVALDHQLLGGPRLGVAAHRARDGAGARGDVAAAALPGDAACRLDPGVEAEVAVAERGADLGALVAHEREAVVAAEHRAAGARRGRESGIVRLAAPDEAALQRVVAALSADPRDAELELVPAGDAPGA